MSSVGPFELVIVLVVVLLVFGAGKMSELGGALGRGIREFREAVSETDEDTDDEG